MTLMVYFFTGMGVRTLNMKDFISKKKVIFLFISLFLSFVLSFWFVFYFFKKDSKIFLNPSKNVKNVDSSSEIKTISTPCRTVSLLPEPDLKHSVQRIKKLDKLMNSPIDWVFRDIHGNVVDFYCLRGKKILIINFWASWCPPCIEELPSLSRLAKNNPNEILVIAISTEPLEVIKNFLSRSFADLSPHLKIAQVGKKTYLKYFPDDQLPTTYIFNKEGLLKVKELGTRDWSEKRLVQQILNLP